MAGKSNRIHVNPVAEKIVKYGLKIFFRRTFNVRLNMPREVKELPPPFILLPNHQGFWDPFLAAVYLNEPVYYLTSDAVFRSRIFGFLLKFLGAIPKTKSQSDLDALKNIFEMKEAGRSIGIFAEGQRTWNGCTLPIIKSTAKLVRMLRVPIVAVVFKGGFLSQQRWSTSIRKGGIEIEYKLLFSGEDAGSMKIPEIYEKLTNAISHDEVAYQKQRKIVWKGDRLAENIEQFLFACPSCGGFDGFSSQNSSFRCRTCGREWQINSMQEIAALNGETVFDNVRDWDLWQLDRMRELIDSKFGSGEVFFRADNTVIHTGFKSRRLKLLSKGAVELSGERFNIFGKKKQLLASVPVSEISGMNVQNREVLDFYYKNTLYTVRDNKKHFNAYRIWRAVDYLQRVKLGLNLPE